MSPKEKESSPFSYVEVSEQRRLNEAREDGIPWKKWGPYLSERQWGTVREDYGADGNAWDYFTHDQSRSRAYRWGEDGMAGFSDDKQQLCFALALWNGRDPILKERMFGLTNSESNHGEDVKEYYFYLDSTPTHSYMKYLYKYPQSEYPYRDLVETNRGRSREEFEYELLDTGIFDDDRYFDVFVEYAKADPEDMLSGCEQLLHNTKSILLPRFQRSDLFGFVAGLGTTFAVLPDLMAMLRRRSTAGMNPRMAAIIGRLSNPLDLLWHLDYLAARGCVERDRRLD